MGDDALMTVGLPLEVHSLSGGAEEDLFLAALFEVHHSLPPKGHRAVI